MSSLLRLERQEKYFLKRIIIIRILFLFLIQLELKRQIPSYTPAVYSKTIPDSRPKWAKSISVFGQKRGKNHTLWDGTCLYPPIVGICFKVSHCFAIFVDIGFNKFLNFIFGLSYYCNLALIISQCHKPSVIFIYAGTL